MKDTFSEMKAGTKIRSHYFFLKVMTGYDLSNRRIPVMEIESSCSGPLVLLTACMHGDETGGTVVIHDLFRLLKTRMKCGKIIAFPILNPFGFEITSRRISISNEDLNRSFPGNLSGSLAQRISAIVMNKIINDKPDLVLDLHNDWNKSIPYVIIDNIENSLILSQLHHYAKISELPAIQESEKISGSFSYSLNNSGIPALTLELGESLVINEKNVVYGISSVLNILSVLGMVDNDPEITGYNLPERARNTILTYSSRPLCNTSGIIRFIKKPGDTVKKGDKLARVYNAFGRLTETISSVQDGIILGHNDYAVAYPGSPVMAFGIYP
ncbi:MAG: succinylglutamate desuccinylase/aspartoacylase family protein [Bacteroidales bacterium]|nr:succinylglutamate desuccinylase/aspartoacylase family protein [Bacteroidales bacterium]